MSLLQDAVPSACLVFIGDGSERASLEQEARALQLRNVQFLPPKQLPYVARLYSIAVAGLVALRNVPLFEGARPSKMFPIMASAKPVVYSGHGEGAALVESARAGLVVPPENPRALADAIRTLLCNPELVGQFGQNGRRYVEENLSWSALVKDWLRQLEERNGSLLT
jgi:glycosyltransferase involved in cell wall biosynthesis